MARIGMKSVRVLSILIVVALCVSAIPMITGKDNVTNAAAAEHDGYVRIGWVSEIVNWNPLLIEMVEDYVATFLIYSCLFTYDEDWGGPINDLATGWYQEVDPVDNSMITYINITHNSYFNSASDLTGKTHQLTAEDVEFTFNLIKSEEGYTYDWYFTEITVLGTANATGTGSFQDQIQLYTEYPKATLIDDITSVPILPMYLWEGYSNPFAGMQPTQLVGSGPFVFED
jgi:ABC-type transport system substrate-binding protein